LERRGAERRALSPGTHGISLGSLLGHFDGYGGGEGRGFQLLVLGHPSSLLFLVVVNDVLVGRTTLAEGIQLVLVFEVLPQEHQLRADLEFAEVFAGHPNVLQLGHEFAVEAAHGVPSEEPGSPPLQVAVDLGEVAVQHLPGRRILLLYQHQLKLTVDIFYERGNLLVLHKEVVAARDVLHDVPLNFVVFQHSQPAVD